MDISFDVNHLSLWLLGSLFEGCNTISTINITFKNFNFTNTRLNFSLVNENNQLIKMFLDHYFEPNNDPKISYILPINRTIKVIFYTLSGEKLGEPDYFNPCLQSNTNATLDYAKFNDINVQIDVQGKCPGKSTTVFPNGTFVINEILSNGKLGRTMITVVKKGKGTLILKDNTKYRMRVTYDKKIKTTEFTFNKSGMSLPSNQGLTGTVTYDARTKTTLLKAQFTIPDCN